MDPRFPWDVTPNADARCCSVGEILPNTVAHAWDAHRYESTLLSFLRSHESALITPAIAGSGTGCAHVEIDAAKRPEIAVRDSASSNQ